MNVRPEAGHGGERLRLLALLLPGLQVGQHAALSIPAHTHFEAMKRFNAFGVSRRILTIAEEDQYGKC